MLKIALKLAPDDPTLGPRQIRVVASTARPDRDGDIMVPRGCVIGDYRKNPIVLADHDRTKPIGTAAITITDAAVVATITFAPEGISTQADSYCALAKAGIINAVSVGFQPIEAEPIPGGHRFTKWTLLELSVVAVPSNPDALVTAKALRDCADRARCQASAEAFRGIMRALDSRAAAVRLATDPGARARARDVEKMRKRGQEIDAWFAGAFPAPPKSWRKVDPLRQIAMIATDERHLSNGKRVVVDGIDLKHYRSAIVLRHDTSLVVAQALDVEKRDGRLHVLAQFPRKGFDALADAVFDAVRDGRLGAVSIGWSTLETGQGVDGVEEVTRSDLREISLAEIGANAGAIVTAIAGKSVGSGVRGRWDDPRAPRAPSWNESGGTSAHYAAALAKYERMKFGQRL